MSRQKAASESRFESHLIVHDFAVLDISPQEPEIHRPAIAGHAIMLIRLGPTRMMKAHLSYALTLLKRETQPRPRPIVVCLDELEFELRIGNAAQHFRK